MATPTREEALALFLEFNQSESLLRHALAVEGVMRHFAEKMEPDAVDRWGVIGLIHDLDYEKYPEEHCVMTEKILRERGWPEEDIRAVLAHGYGIVNDVEPMADVEKVLFTIDELTGLIAATALMRPSKSVLDMEPKSVKKKWKDKGFAAGVNREVIAQGAEMLGMDLNDVIRETILGMRNVAAEIGLEGNPA